MASGGKLVLSPARRVAVVGAGVSGLVAAAELGKRGFDVTIYEVDHEVGGMLAPVKFAGMALDRGSHRLHTEARQSLAAVGVDASLQRRPRRGRLLLGGRAIRYPLRPVELALGLGLSGILQTACHVARSGLRDLSSKTKQRASRGAGYETTMRARVGDRAFAALYQPYAEKVWGRADDGLCGSVAERRLSSSRPGQLVARSVSGLLPFSRRRDDHFYYPRQGMAGLCGALRDAAAAAGVVFRGGRRITRATLSTLDADKIVFTGRLADIAGTGGDPPWSLLHQGLYLVYLLVPSSFVADADTWYVPESRYWFGRVSRPERFSRRFARPKETVLCLEIPAARHGLGGDFLAAKDVLISQLQDARVLSRGCRVVAVTQRFLGDVYPMYHRSWRRDLNMALGRLAQFDPRVYPAGRQGLFLHCNIDHCADIARDVAHAVASGMPSDTWINSARRYQCLSVRD